VSLRERSGKRKKRDDTIWYRDRYESYNTDAGITMAQALLSSLIAACGRLPTATPVRI
jgi:hypothetical protein